jgi:general secretion pathway protein K
MRVVVRTTTSPARQRGAALLMAMVIVTMVTTIAASMVWQQWRSVQVESAERALVQSQWILRGALDFARIILREDARTGGADHLGEQWAVGLAESRISTFLAADRDNTDDAPEGFFSGQITDATSRYNLYNLIDMGTGDVEPKQLAALKRLCEYTSLSPSLADAIAQALRKAVLAAAAQADPDKLAKLGGEEARRAAPLLPQTVDQLVWLGLDAGTVERLRPYVILLPPMSETTKINVNTAPREVIAAVMEGVGLGNADRLIQVRQRNHFKDLEEVRLALGVASLPDAAIDVSSAYFEIQGRVRLEDRVLAQSYLVQRTMGGEGTVTVLFENQVAGIELADPSAGAR